MNWTMPYPWRSRSDSVRRINMSSEPGNESFFCALRPIPRILSLRRRDYASQVQIGEASRRKTISGCSRAPDGNRYGARCRCRQQATSNLNWPKKGNYIVDKPEPEAAMLVSGVTGRNGSTTVNRFVFHESIASLGASRSEEHTSELQSLRHLVCRLL